MTLNAKAIAVAVVAVVAALLLWNAGVAYGRYQAVYSRLIEGAIISPL